LQHVHGTLEVHAEQVHHEIDGATAAAVGTCVEKPWARAEDLVVASGNARVPSARVVTLPRPELGVLLQVVRNGAQDNDSVEGAPPRQCQVIHSPATHFPLPPDPRPLLASERLSQVLTIARFRNNARRDNLEGFWRSEFGHTHGLVAMDAFFENVNRHRAEGRELGAGEEVENLILEFRPQSSEPMLAACLWSRWSAPGEPDLLSFAAITDDPPPEVAAAGHDRCVIPIKPAHIDAWLNPDPVNLKALYANLDDRERPYSEHRLAA
jgi:hypothetical protein